MQAPVRNAQGSERRVATSFVDFAVTTFGDPSGTAVLLLHGWPDDRLAWHDIAAQLADRGYYVVVPSLAGSGTSVVTNGDVNSAGQLPALVQSVVELLDSIAIDARPVHVVGHDWGARTAYGVAIVRPRVVRSLTAISAGWSPASADADLPSARQLQQFWYQWLLNTPMGEEALRRNRRHLVAALWAEWSPNWNVPAEDLDAVIDAVGSEQWVAVTVGYYRNRWWWGEADPRFADVAAQLSAARELDVPTLVIHGEVDRCVLPSVHEDMARFVRSRFRRRLLPGLGHFPHRENSDAVFAEILDWITYPDMQAHEAV